jgi:predicted dehydrogenase
MAGENSMNIGILGYGSIGKRHFNNANRLGHEVMAYEPQFIAGTRAERGFVIEWADAIIVASPTECHLSDMHDAIAANKHVLVEKPIAYDDSKLTHHLLTTASANNLIVATGFNLRFHSCVQEAARILANGTLGEIESASFSVLQKTEKPPYLRDGIIRNWLSHEIDLAHFLLGDGEVIRCTAPIDAEGKDSTEAFIELKFPAIKDRVFIAGDYHTDPEQRYWWIQGEEALLCCNMIRRELYMKTNGDISMIFRGEDSFDQNYIDELRDFIVNIETGSHSPWLATGEDGVRSLRTVMAARTMAGLE